MPSGYNNGMDHSAAYNDGESWGGGEPGQPGESYHCQPGSDASPSSWCNFICAPDDLPEADAAAAAADLQAMPSGYNDGESWGGGEPGHQPGSDTSPSSWCNFICARDDLPVAAAAAAADLQAMPSGYNNGMDHSAAYNDGESWGGGGGAAGPPARRVSPLPARQ